MFRTSKREVLQKFYIMKNIFWIILFFLPSILYSQKTTECYNTSKYGMIVEKCTYEMNRGDVLQFDNYEIYICQIETFDNKGLKCEIKYREGDVGINSTGIITPIVEEIPGDNRMKKITYTNDAWQLYNNRVLKITAYQKIRVTIMKRIG